MLQMNRTVKIAVGEIAAANDFIAVLRQQVRDLGGTPAEYDGPRGMESFGTDNHVKPVSTILDDLDLLELAHRVSSRPREIDLQVV